MKYGKYIFTLIIASLMLNTSCATYMVNKEAAKTVAMRKALMTNNEAAMKTLRNGEDAVDSGIDVSAWEAFKERPLLHIGAGLVDGGALVAGYKGIEKIDDGSDNVDRPIGGDNINVNGDSNTININK